MEGVQVYSLLAGVNVAASVWLSEMVANYPAPHGTSGSCTWRNSARLRSSHSSELHSMPAPISLSVWRVLKKKKAAAEISTIYITWLDVAVAVAPLLPLCSAAAAAVLRFNSAR